MHRNQWTYNDEYDKISVASYKKATFSLLEIGVSRKPIALNDDVNRKQNGHVTYSIHQHTSTINQHVAYTKNHFIA